MYFYDDLDTLHWKVDLMKHRAWFDNHTKEVELSMPDYNAEYGVFTLVHMDFFLSRGGHTWKDVITLSVRSPWNRNMTSLIVDIMFGAFFAG